MKCYCVEVCIVQKRLKKRLLKTKPYVTDDLEELEKYRDDPFTGFCIY